jgi:hypothetical protein
MLKYYSDELRLQRVTLHVFRQLTCLLRSTLFLFTTMRFQCVECSIVFLLNHDYLPCEEGLWQLSVSAFRCQCAGQIHKSDVNRLNNRGSYMYQLL